MHMELVRTTKIKIALPLDTAQRTGEQWNAACNYISQVAFEHGRMSNAVHLHRLTYGDVRERFGLSAQVTQNAIRQVAGKYASARTAKITLKHPVYFKPHNAVALQGGERGRDFSFLAGGLSLWTVDGRMKQIAFRGEPKLIEYLAHWQMGDARLFVRKGEIYMSVSFKREVPSVETPNNAVIGVDRGINYLAVTTDGQKSLFAGGKRVKHIRKRYARTRASLQQKKAKHPTRSIRRALKRLSGKEARFNKDTNHVLTRRIVEFAQAHPGGTRTPTIALEKLDDIRDNTKRRLSKKVRRDVNGWPFYQFEDFLTYKAAAFGFQVIEVEAKGTSKGCSRCGHAESANRNRHSFVCKACGYSLHSDLNAARNIRLRGVIVRQALNDDAALSVVAKAHVLTDDGQAPLL